MTDPVRFAETPAAASASFTAASDGSKPHPRCRRQRTRPRPPPPTPHQPRSPANTAGTPSPHQQRRSGPTRTGPRTKTTPTPTTPAPTDPVLQATRTRRKLRDDPDQPRDPAPTRHPGRGPRPGTRGFGRERRRTARLPFDQPPPPKGCHQTARPVAVFCAAPTRSSAGAVHPRPRLGNHGPFTRPPCAAPMPNPPRPEPPSPRSPRTLREMSPEILPAPDTNGARDPECSWTRDAADSKVPFTNSATPYTNRPSSESGNDGVSTNSSQPSPPQHKTRTKPTRPQAPAPPPRDQPGPQQRSATAGQPHHASTQHDHPAPTLTPKKESGPATSRENILRNLLQLTPQLLQLLPRLIQRSLRLRPRRTTELSSQRTIPHIRIRQHTTLRIQRRNLISKPTSNNRLHLTNSSLGLLGRQHTRHRTFLPIRTIATPKPTNPGNDPKLPTPPINPTNRQIIVDRT